MFTSSKLHFLCLSPISFVWCMNIPNRYKLQANLNALWYIWCIGYNIRIILKKIFAIIFYDRLRMLNFVILCTQHSIHKQFPTNIVHVISVLEKQINYVILRGFYFVYFILKKKHTHNNNRITKKFCLFVFQKTHKVVLSEIVTVKDSWQFL